MKIPQQLKTFVSCANKAFREWGPPPDAFPTDLVDLIVYHKLNFSLDPAQAWKCFQQLKSEFVDWNEVRVSSVLEIQNQLAPAPDALQLAVFIKDLLEHIHRQRQKVSLEHVLEGNLTDVRRYFKGIKGIDAATVDLILLRRKEHPVIPLTAPMVRVLSRRRLVRPQDTLDRKQKRLFEQVGPELAVPFHLLLLSLCRAHEPADDRTVDAYFGRRRPGGRRRAPASAAPRRRVLAKAAAGKRVRKK